MVVLQLIEQQVRPSRIGLHGLKELEDVLVTHHIVG